MGLALLVATVKAGLGNSDVFLFKNYRGGRDVIVNKINSLFIFVLFAPLFKNSPVASWSTGLISRVHSAPLSLSAGKCSRLPRSKGQVMMDTE